MTSYNLTEDHGTVQAKNDLLMTSYNLTEDQS